MNINMTGFRCTLNLCILVLQTKVALALDGLSVGKCIGQSIQSPNRMLITTIAKGDVEHR